MLKSIGVNIGGGSVFGQGVYFHVGGEVHLGRKCKVGDFFKLWSYSPVSIGDNLLASHNVTIISGSHRADSLEFVPGRVDIGRDVWIGANVTIIGPVCIGDGCIIGAGAVVVRDLPSNFVCVGVPCKPVHHRYRDSGGMHGSRKGGE